MNALIDVIQAIKDRMIGLSKPVELVDRSPSESRYL
jgi:hypothetical protein